jgi:hypothetical protein
VWCGGGIVVLRDFFAVMVLCYVVLIGATYCIWRNLYMEVWCCVVVYDGGVVICDDIVVLCCAMRW